MSADISSYSNFLYCSSKKMTDVQRVPFNAAAKNHNGKGAANKERQNAEKAQRELAEKALQAKRSIEGIVLNGKKGHGKPREVGFLEPSYC